MWFDLSTGDVGETGIKGVKGDKGDVGAPVCYLSVS